MNRPNPPGGPPMPLGVFTRFDLGKEPVVVTFAPPRDTAQLMKMIEAAERRFFGPVVLGTPNPVVVFSEPQDPHSFNVTKGLDAAAVEKIIAAERKRKMKHATRR